MRSIVLLQLLVVAQQEPPTLQDICAAFHAFDLDRDGKPEIVDLKLRSAAPKGKPLVLLREKRLADLDVSVWISDLRKEGWRPLLVEAEVYSGRQHQDGLTLLAIREFLRKVRAWEQSLAGAVLVGSFPEATVVRSYNWVKRSPFRIGKKVWKEPVWYLRTVPEVVAKKCELVLCDLDGRWERLYRRERQKVPSVIGVFPDGVPERGGICRDYVRKTHVFEDFFFVNDGHYEAHELEEGGLSFVPLRHLRDFECSDEDRKRPNPLARPEIFVSRVNARGVALALKDGKWTSDATLERKLLEEFFERNHRYRAGAFRKQFRPASFSHSLGPGFESMRKAAAFPETGIQVKGKPSVLDFVTWMKWPAVLRDFRAHSTPLMSALERADAKKMEEACGAPVPRAAKSGRVDFALLRTLWETGALPDGASFYVHTGCEAISPPGWSRHAYSDPEYGWMQGAESMLFFGRGLALVGRAKVFYDSPRGFYAALSEGETFGGAWARYFDIESRAKTLREVGGGIGRKRSYFWSLIGDWTLRLEN